MKFMSDKCELKVWYKGILGQDPDEPLFEGEIESETLPKLIEEFQEYHGADAYGMDGIVHPYIWKVEILYKKAK